MCVCARAPVLVLPSPGEECVEWGCRGRWKDGRGGGLVWRTPKPEVQWMKGDKELGKKASKRMLFEEEEVDGGLMKYKLTIKDIDMKDFGEASTCCEA